MKPSTHRYVLAPVLFGIHAVLLLPLVFSPEKLRPPRFHGHPWPDFDPDLKYQDFKSKIGRLYLQYSIPLGIVGIVGVYLSKQLAGNIPLPKDPRRKRLAQILEGSVLFGIGVLEEVWRWVLVRLLVRLMGGHGGYRGTLEHLRKTPEGGYTDVEGVLEEAVGPLGISPESPRLWEGLYLMSWVWSVIECLYSWYGIRPIPGDSARQNTRTSPVSSPKSIKAHFRRNSEGPTLSSHRPTLGKRTRSDSITGANEYEYDPRETRRIFNSLGRKRRELPAVKSREIEDRSVQFADNTTAAESESSRTVYDESIRPANSSLLTGKTIDADLETGLLSRLREVRLEQAEEQVDSDNGYGDDEESVSSDSDSCRSSIDSTRFESVTPLLSSSLPYDPSQQHPHHESQALLQNQRQQITYNTIVNSLPLEPTNSNEDAIVTVHECDHEDGFSDHRRDQTPNMQRSPVDRVYPSYPPYSSSCNHAHFSTSAAGPSSAVTINRPVPLKRKPTDNSFKIQRCNNKTVYGANVNTLPLHLPVLWRAAALLRHISHALIYAWAPALAFRGHFQWASFLVLFLLAAKKGWSTVEWFGGGASRTGLMKASIVSLIVATTLYLVSFFLWGIIL